MILGGAHFGRTRIRPHKINPYGHHREFSFLELSSRTVLLDGFSVSVGCASATSQEALPRVLPLRHQSSTGNSTDGFGCSLKQLSINQSLPGSDIDIFRKATVNTELDQVMTPATDRGFVVGVSSGATRGASSTNITRQPTTSPRARSIFAISRKPIRRISAVLSISYYLKFRQRPSAKLPMMLRCPA